MDVFLFRLFLPFKLVFFFVFLAFQNTILLLEIGKFFYQFMYVGSAVVDPKNGFNIEKTHRPMKKALNFENLWIFDNEIDVTELRQF